MLDILRRYVQVRRWVVGAGVAVTAAACVIYAEVLPRVQQAHRLWTTWTSHRERLERGAGWQEEIDRLQAEHERLRTRYGERLTPLAPKGRTSVTLDLLRQAARDHDAELQTIRPGPLTEEKAHAERLITLRANGAFPALTRFVRAIEEAPYLMQVRALRIAAPSPADERLEAEIVVRMFLAADDAGPHRPADGASIEP